MSNANRIVARNPLNPENLERRRPKRWHLDDKGNLKKPGITVYRGITPAGRRYYHSTAGRHYYHSDDGIPASLPYVCAVSRKPYNGNSDRMKRGQP